ncbi:hypothetical protein EHM76_04830 [bacterium]|nr:MAG: hypothetical protein EHM76_04830 [bacterium]
MVLLAAFFVITAMPPSGMFVSEFLVFKSLFASGYLWVLILLMILLTVIIWALGKNIFRILFIKPVAFDESRFEPVPVSESVSQYALLALVVYLGLAPPRALVSLIEEVVSRLPG